MASYEVLLGCYLLARVAFFLPITLTKSRGVIASLKLFDKLYFCGSDTRLDTIFIYLELFAKLRGYGDTLAGRSVVFCDFVIGFFGLLDRVSSG